MPLIEFWKKVVLQNYANFSGRANRAEFWWFVLANAIVSGVLQILGNASTIFTVLAAVYGLAVLIPALAVAVRRLHDTNRSGWWLLIGLVPCVGIIILIVFYATPGMPTDNDHGPVPA